MAVPVFPPAGGGGGGGSLPAGTGIVEVTGGVGGLAVAYTDYLPGGDWYSNEVLAHKAFALGFTSSVPIVPGVSAQGAPFPAALGDAGKQGGAVRGLAGTPWVALAPGTPYQNLKTSKFAISFQGSFATIAASQYTLFGVGTTTGHVVGFGTNNAVSSTKFYMSTTDGVGTNNVTSATNGDVAVHTWRLVSDATTVTLYMDGVSIATQATSYANFPTDAGGPIIIGTTASSGQALYKVLYSYVGI